MDETKFQQIEDYLNGELTGTALSEFEAQLNSDPALKTEVELHRDIDIALMDEDEIPFVQTLRDIHAKAPAEAEAATTPTKEDDSKPSLYRRILPFAVAAAAAILIAVFVLPILFPAPDAMQLSENTIGDAPTLDIDRSTDMNETTKNLLASYQKIEGKQYADAIPELTKIYETTSNNQADLGLGYCHLQVKNYANAIGIFEEIQVKNDTLRDVATWYLAHAHLRNGNIQESKHILQKIISANNVTLKRREQAENLLNDLEKIN